MTDETTQTPETPQATEQQQAPPPPAAAEPQQQMPPPPQQMAPPPQMVPPSTTMMTEAEINDGKIFAFLAYFLGLIGFIIVLVAKKDNRFAMYHAKQALVLIICNFIVGFVLVIPILGWIVGGLAGVALFVFWIMGIVNALSGKAEELPVVGKYAEKFNF